MATKYKDRYDAIMRDAWCRKKGLLSDAPVWLYAFKFACDHHNNRPSNQTYKLILEFYDKLTDYEKRSYNVVLPKR